MTIVVIVLWLIKFSLSLSTSTTTTTRGRSRIRQGREEDCGECSARAYNRGLGVEPPAGSMVRAPGVCSWGKSPEALEPPELNSFCPFSYKRGAKINDLNETI